MIFMMRYKEALKVQQGAVMTDLLEMLRQRAMDGANGKQRKGAGIRFFLASQAEIEAAINEKWPYRDIYDALLERGQGDLPISYRTFCAYIWKYITRKRKIKNSRILLSEDSGGLKPHKDIQETGPVKMDAGVRPKGFFHDPVPVEEDLL